MKVENKVKQIIREEFDERVSMMVVQYILDKGTENLKEITEEEILQVKGNGLMTDKFVQALVRTGVRISKECNMIDDFLPYIVTELYVPKAKMNELDLYSSDYTEESWKEILNDLDLDDNVEAVKLKATVIKEYTND